MKKPVIAILATFAVLSVGVYAFKIDSDPEQPVLSKQDSLRIDSIHAIQIIKYFKNDTKKNRNE